MIDRDEPMSREPDVFDTRCTASFVDEGIGILLNARIKRALGQIRRLGECHSSNRLKIEKVLNVSQGRHRPQAERQGTQLDLTHPTLVEEFLPLFASAAINSSQRYRDAKNSRKLRKLLIYMVGTAGFEPTTSTV